MQEILGDLFTFNPRTTPIEQTPDSVEDLLNFKPSYGKILRCVTTNGVVKNNGSLVMGAGVAKEAAKRFPELPHLLGQLVDERGNHVFVFDQFGVASFPTKHHWKENSDLQLIEQSCRELVWLSKKWDFVLLPRVGCGMGGLDWENEVKPLVSKYFTSDKFIIVRSS